MQTRPGGDNTVLQEMEALAELLAALMTLLIEATFYALVFIFLLVMAIFSPRYRTKLKSQWDNSRFGIVLGVTMYSAALIVALFFWIPYLTRGTNDVGTTDSKRSITIQSSDDQVERTKNTKEIGQLVETVGSLIERKLAERKEAQQVAPPNGQ